MSLRDLRVYAPLGPNHPLVRDERVDCWICEKAIAVGTRTAIKPRESSEESGSLTVEGSIVCATCFLRGEEIQTPAGRRIVDRVKDGDGSPYPVITTDGGEWRDGEVGP